MEAIQILRKINTKLNKPKVLNFDVVYFVDEFLIKYINFKIIIFNLLIHYVIEILKCSIEDSNI